jgi:hypothetical protein
MNCNGIAGIFELTLGYSIKFSEMFFSGLFILIISIIYVAFFLYSTFRKAFEKRSKC